MFNPLAAEYYDVVRYAKQVFQVQLAKVARELQSPKGSTLNLYSLPPLAKNAVLCRCWGGVVSLSLSLMSVWVRVYEWVN